MGVFTRKSKQKVERETLSSASTSSTSYSSSPVSTPSSQATNPPAVSDQEKFTVQTSQPPRQDSYAPRQDNYAPRQDNYPPRQDNRIYTKPQGPTKNSSRRVARTCPACDSPCMRLITRTSNRNNNPGRPFIKCTNGRCDKFVCWDDEIGTFDGNPPCFCDKPSRQSMSGAAKGRKIYYECVTGKCTFWEAHVDEYGNPVSFGGDPADEIARMRL